MEWFNSGVTKPNHSTHGGGVTVGGGGGAGVTLRCRNGSPNGGGGDATVADGSVPGIREGRLSS